MPSYQELLSQIEELKVQAEETRRQEIASAIAEIRQRMAELGITVEDLAGATRRVARRRGASGTVKYRNPQTGQTWSGKGRRPAWIRDAANPDEFLA